MCADKGKALRTFLSFLQASTRESSACVRAYLSSAEQLGLSESVPLLLAEAAAHWSLFAIESLLLFVEYLETLWNERVCRDKGCLLFITPNTFVHTF